MSGVIGSGAPASASPTYYSNAPLTAPLTTASQTHSTANLTGTSYSIAAAKPPAQTPTAVLRSPLTQTMPARDAHPKAESAPRSGRVFPTIASTILTGALLTLAGCENDVSMVAEKPPEDYPAMDFIQQPEQITDLDIWVVLDTSCSMDDNFSAVGQGMVTLQEDIDGLVDDSQFWFMNTDPTSPHVIGPYDSSQTIDIQMAPSMLSYQTGAEAGYASSYLAYNANPGMLRSEASLLIFFISDEEEQSGISTDVYHDEFLVNLKEEGKLDVVTIGLLPTETSPCVTNSDGSLTADGDAPACKYIDLVQRYFNKDPVDLLSPGWDAWLAGASFLTALSTEIQLTQTPDVASIVVYLNHDELPQSDWEYDEGANMVYLNFVPNYEDVIAVVYDVAIPE